MAPRPIQFAAIAYAAFTAAWYARYVYIVITLPLPPPMVDPGRTGAPEHIPSFAYYTQDAHTSLSYAVRRLDEPAVLPDKPSVSAALVSDRGDTRWYAVTAPEAFRARFHIYYWPLWKLSVAGTRIETTPDEHGIMTAMLPAGKYSAKLRLEASKSELWGPWISLAGIAVLVVVACVGYTIERKERRL